MRLSRGLIGDDAIVLEDRNFRLILLTALLGPLGTTLVSPLIDTLVSVFEVSPATIGLLVSALTAPGIVMIPLMGALADAYGRKYVLIAGVLLFGLAGGAVTLTTEFTHVLALRVVQGIGFSGMVPTLITIIGDNFDGTEEATAHGVRMMMVGISNVAFPLLAGVLVLVAWQFPFLIYLIAVPIAVILAIRLEEVEVGEDDAGDGSGSREAYSTRELLGVATKRRVAPVLFGRAMPTVAWLGFLTYNSIVVVQLLDQTPVEAGLLIALSSVMFAVSASQAGRLMAVFDGRFYPILCGYVTMGVGFTLFAFAPSLAVAVVGALAGGFGFGVATALYRSLLTGLGHPRMRGGLVSLGESLGRVGATGTPIGMGLVIGGLTPIVGFGPSLRWTLGGVTVVGCVLGIASLQLAHSAAATWPRSEAAT